MQMLEAYLNDPSIGLFLSVSETIVGALLCCEVGIVNCLRP